MSRAYSRELNPSSFAGRLAEACGTREPAKIKQLLNISYQAAKNYLNGRLPNAEVLLALARVTPYSIHWILTGQGNRFVFQRNPVDTPLAPGQLDEMVREICVEVINDLSGNGEESMSRIVVLQPSDVLSETPVLQPAELERRGS
ncbi:MAG: hypothetical protein JO053_12175 [Acidobacteria bacterium]|nr:hypothetical protein [Acidobacteriota bacterium]